MTKGRGHVHSPAGRRVQREREERVPKRIVHGDLQLAGQPQQTIVVGQLAVTGSGAHDVAEGRSSLTDVTPPSPHR